MRGAAAALLETIALAAWLGAALLFVASVAPTLFAVLPARGLAGAVVGRVLPAIFYSGILIGGIVLAGLVRARGALAGGWREICALVLLASCAVAQLVVSPRIERVRQQIAGPIEALGLADPRRQAFGRLHAISVGWLGLAMLAAVVALASAARSLDARP